MNMTTSNSILIVDDTPNNIKILMDVLNNVGYEVSVAKSGEIALEKLPFIQPDLILLDVMMPGIDGFETCRRLKADKSTKNIPVIFSNQNKTMNDSQKGKSTSRRKANTHHQVAGTHSPPCQPGELPVSP